MKMIGSVKFILVLLNSFSLELSHYYLSQIYFLFSSDEKMSSMLDDAWLMKIGVSPSSAEKIKRRPAIFDYWVFRTSFNSSIFFLEI